MPLTRRLILQKARNHPTPAKTGPGFHGLKASGFRNYFTPLPGYFSPFPHGTNPLSVIKKYSGLPNGLGRFTQDSTSPALLGHHTLNHSHEFRLRDYHTLRSVIPNCSTTPHEQALSAGEQTTSTAPQPPVCNPRQVSHTPGLAILRFRSPLLTEYLFLRVLRCFTSPRSPQTTYTNSAGLVTRHNPGQVSPFGHPRINTRSPTPRGISQAATSFISS